MSIAALVRRMAEAGAPPEAIALAVEAVEAEQAKEAARKAKRAGQKRQERDRRATVAATSHDAPPSDKEKSPEPPKEITTPHSAPKGASYPPREKLEVDEAIRLYSEMAQRSGLAVPRAITPARRQRIAARLREHGLPTWTEAVNRIEASNFCRGQNDRGWRADLDFLLQDKSFVSLLEGKYGGEPSTLRGDEFCPDDWENTRYLLIRFREERSTDPPRSIQGGKAGYLLPAEWVALSRSNGRTANA